jgi:hypothetical protein
MDFYFEGVFSNLDRDSLNERFKRRELVEYFNTVITGCAKGCVLNIKRNSNFRGALWPRSQCASACDRGS